MKTHFTSIYNSVNHNYTNRMITKIYKRTFIAVLVALTASTAQAWTFTWNGSSGSDWNTAANWTRTGTNNGSHTVPGSTDNVVINNGSLSNQPETFSNISVLNFSMSAGVLDLNGNTLTVGSTANLTGGTIRSGWMDANDFTEIRNMNFAADGSFFVINKTGGNDDFTYGGNSYTGPVAILNSSSATFRLASTQAETFTGTIHYEERSTGELQPAYNGVNIYPGDLSTQGSPELVSFGLGSGTVVLNGATTFYGELFFIRYLVINTTQSVSLLESLSVDRLRMVNGTFDINNNTFTANNDVWITGGRIEDGTLQFDDIDSMQNTTFENLNIIKQNGGGDNTVRGGNTFLGTIVIRNNGIGDDWRMANVVGDDYNGDVTFLQMSSGLLEPAYNGNNTFAGNISTEGTLNAINFCEGSGWVIIDGNTSQFMYGSAARNPRFERFRMNTNGSFQPVDLQLIIDVELDLDNGYINSGTTNPVVISNGASVGSVSNSSHVTGVVRKIGDDNFTFPVGDGTFYAPLRVTNYASASNSTAFDASYYNTAYSNLNVVSGLDHVSNEEYWILDRTNTSASVRVQLSWNSDRSGPVDNLADLRVARFNGTSWVSQGSVSTSGNTSAGTVGTNGGVSQFSPFTIGSSSSLNPLPVSLLSFTAVPVGNHVLVSWTTTNELNNDYFTVEKSLDGLTWSAIGTVDGAGSTEVTLQYQLTDMDPVQGIQYYRLKQTDLDGASTWSNKVPVKFNSGSTRNIVVYPQPAGDVLNVALTGNENGDAAVVVYNTMGQKVIEKYNLEGNSIRMDISSLPAGLYTLELIVDGQPTNMNIVKQ